MTVPGTQSNTENAYRILLIEDSDADIFLVKLALRQRGFTYALSVLNNGEEALRYIFGNEPVDPESTPHIILLDLNLPRIDGAEVLARIRSSPAFVAIPIVMLTSSTSPEDRKKVLALGASSFFPKPPGLQAFMELGSVVEKLLTPLAA